MQIMTRNNGRRPSRPKQGGFSLIEVLIAVLVFSVGLLGLAGLQAISLKNVHSAYLRTQATFLAYDMIDRMRANKNAADSYKDPDDTFYTGTYISPSGDCPVENSACDCFNVECSQVQLAHFDKEQWLDDISLLLPNSASNIAVENVGGDNIYSIHVRWRDRTPKKKEDQNQTPEQQEQNYQQTFTVSARL
jgi:type IV pilus assembly protein PilV